MRLGYCVAAVIFFLPSLSPTDVISRNSINESPAPSSAYGWLQTTGGGGNAAGTDDVTEGAHAFRLHARPSGGHSSASSRNLVIAGGPSLRLAQAGGTADETPLNLPLAGNAVPRPANPLWIEIAGSPVRIGTTVYNGKLCYVVLDAEGQLAVLPDAVRRRLAVLYEMASTTYLQPEKFNDLQTLASSLAQVEAGHYVVTALARLQDELVNLGVVSTAAFFTGGTVVLKKLGDILLDELAEAAAETPKVVARDSARVVLAVSRERLQALLNLVERRASAQLGAVRTSPLTPEEILTAYQAAVYCDTYALTSGELLKELQPKADPIAQITRLLTTGAKSGADAVLPAGTKQAVVTMVRAGQLIGALAEALPEVDAYRTAVAAKTDFWRKQRGGLGDSLEAAPVYATAQFLVPAAERGVTHYLEDGDVAYVSDESGNSEIWTARSSDPTVRRQVSHFDGALNPAWLRWSPDGRWIAFQAATATGTEIFAIGSDGQEGQKQLTSTPGEGYVQNPDFGHSSGWVYYEKVTPRRFTDIYRVNIATRAIESVSINGGTNVHSFDISDDGRYVMEMRENGCCWTPNQYTVLRDLSTGNEKLILAKDGQSEWFGRISHDNRKIVYMQASGYQPPNGLYVVNVETEDKKVLVAPRGNIRFFPAWGPDGDRLLVQESAGGRDALYFLDAATGVLTAFIGGKANYRSPDWRH